MPFSSSGGVDDYAPRWEGAPCDECGGRFGSMKITVEDDGICFFFCKVECFAKWAYRVKQSHSINP